MVPTPITGQLDTPGNHLGKAEKQLSEKEHALQTSVGKATLPRAAAAIAEREATKSLSVPLLGTWCLALATDRAGSRQLFQKDFSLQLMSPRASVYLVLGQLRPSGM